MAYTAAKNGCKGLVRSGVVQLSSSNIRVNAVAPALWTRWGSEYYNRSAALGEVAVFLALDLAVVINGQVIVADSEKSVAASGGAVL
ncbi:uncharacterized protein N7487_005073 [Penicillium crustosum]|uniref:uncharacterized protein n=1 Tax=Penicillium crustosum TaxID=36656 RepID=UPI002385623F|nr:uncharacterized protein N7487_005073 [Penicillium crustosum]KAJ5410714.1 hypothetical protein N7487_005073 [Penicillium crustosum]